MKILLTRKLGMTQTFDPSGQIVVATVLKAEDNVVSAIKTKPQDGYQAIQVSTTGSKRVKQPIAGQLKKIGREGLAVFREFSWPDEGEAGFKLGQPLGVEQFSVKDQVIVRSISKGKGFAGTIKRHGFARGPASHGSMNIRQPGSIGAQQPQRVIKGKRMAGRLGGETVNIKNLTILDVDPKNQLLVLKGSVPGPKRGLVMIQRK